MEASSIPSDPQRRKPDDQTCCDGVVESSTGYGWLIEGADAGTYIASLKLTEEHELRAGRHRVRGRPSAEGVRNEAPRA